MSIPLAERLRPRTLDDYIGQEHLVGGNGVFRKFLETGNVPSFILWGPPGVGKTTLAQIIANKLETPFYTLSAVTSGVKDVRDVIEKARSNRFFSQCQYAHRRGGTYTGGKKPVASDRKSTRLNSSHDRQSRMPSSA